MAEEGAPFRPDMDDDGIPEMGDDFFRHARLRRGKSVIREATARLTGEGVVLYPTAEKDE